MVADRYPRDEEGLTMMANDDGSGDCGCGDDCPCKK
jgi:hypothetical protein